MDGLREKSRIQRHQLEAAEKELAALKSGVPESRSIAESAEVLAAQRDAALTLAKAQAAIIRCYEQGVAVPQSLLSEARGLQSVLS